MISARRMSADTWSPTCGAAIAPPPSVTYGSARIRASIASVAPRSSRL